MQNASKIIVSDKQKLEFIEVNLSSPVGKQVLLKGILSGISHGTELAVIKQTTPTFYKKWDKKLRCFVEGAPSKKYPASLGYGYVGEVISIGNEVSELKIGDVVWADESHQTYNLIDIDKTPYLKLSDKKAANKAAFLALTRVALAGVHDADAKIGDRVFVSGLGVVGLITVRLLQLAGIKEIYASDPFEFRRKRAESMGIEVSNPDEVDIGAWVKEKTNGGVDLAIECSGASFALHHAIKACDVGGKVVSVATYRTGSENLFLGEEWHRNRITMVSSMSVNNCPHRQFPLWDIQRLNNTALKLLHDNDIDVESLITHIIDFKDAKQAYQIIQENPDKTLGVILKY